METLITGASGLLGNHLTRLFLSHGDRVRVMLEHENADDGLDKLEVEIFICDIRDPMQVKDCAKGMDVVVHAAADTSTWPNRSDQVHEINVRGTQLLIEEALRSGTKRFIYVSSASAFNWGCCRCPGTENSGKRRFNYKITYYESKYHAQEAVLKAVRERGLPGIVVNPTFMVGPHDYKMNAARLVGSIMHRKVPGYPPGGRNFVHARDVARAIYNAVESGRVGECYILGNENLSYRKFFEKVGEVSGQRVPMLYLPAFLICLTGLVQTLFAYLSGSPPQISYNMARGSCQQAYYSSEKARKYLQFSSTPISVAIQETIEWLENHKTNGHV
jgi:dihydroflavonol-4-reductase